MTEIDTPTFARLRFLANAAVAALSYPATTPAEGSIAEGLVKPDASVDMIRTLLRHALPVLRATSHTELARLIEEALGEAPEPH